MLHRLTGEIGGGGALQGVLARQRPPIHFLRRDTIAHQLQRWGEAQLRRALEIAGEGERASRGDQALGLSAAARALLQIALLGSGRPRRRAAR
jgi:DNA polymerase-3 subunit delta